METSEVRRLKDLERENAELKKMVALSRSTYRDRPGQAVRIELTSEIIRLSYHYDRFGYRKIHVLLVNSDLDPD